MQYQMTNDRLPFYCVSASSKRGREEGVQERVGEGMREDRKEDKQEGEGCIWN